MVPVDPAPCPTAIPHPDAPPVNGGGRIKVEPEDFVVEEIPSYEPCGEGDHLYLYVRKRDVSGPLLLREVARQSGVRPADIGSAGVKDRRAVTSQWISLPAGQGVSPVTGGPVGSGGSIEILRSEKHTNKLRTGHLKGNRFSVRIHGREPADDHAVSNALKFYAEHGFPNTFGGQRFGGGALEEGLRFLTGTGRSRGRRQRFAISAVQSWIFNHWLAGRISSERLTSAVPGDVLKRRESGGLFVCESPDEDTVRLQKSEVILTGPMPGSRPGMVTGDAAAEEVALVRDLGLEPTAFVKMGRGGRGTRRPALSWPRTPECGREGDALVVSFELDSGVYATVLLELICGAPLHMGPQPTTGEPPS